jgi:glutaredoxin
MGREHRQHDWRHGARHGSAWRTAAALIGLALLVVAGAAAAQSGQIYKWKDALGETHYSDTPPPQGAQTLKVAGQADANANANTLPYELARAVRQHPVTLYTTARCDACDQGRALLRARGIPYTEKTVDTLNDQQEQRRLTGKDELPLLLVGSRRVVGFQSAGWQEALDSAAYPRQKMLPSGYQYAAPTPAASATANAPSAPVRAQIKVPPDEAAAQAAQAQAHDKTPAVGSAPPNPQF